MEETEDHKVGTHEKMEIISAYTLQAETYDAIDTEAFYINEYKLYDKHLTKLKPYGVIGIDITYPLLEKAKEKFKDNSHVLLMQADALSLPFPDSCFDFISSYGLVISHIHDYEKAFSEMKRVIKPGGIVGISALNKWNLHLIYHPKELKDAILLKKTGQWRKWECVYSVSGERVSLKLKSFSFNELKTLLKKNCFEPFYFIGAHILSLIIPLKFQYGMRVNYWGKLYYMLGKVDNIFNTKFPFYKLGYSILIGAKCVK